MEQAYSIYGRLTHFYVIKSFPALLIRVVWQWPQLNWWLQSKITPPAPTKTCTLQSPLTTRSSALKPLILGRHAIHIGMRNSRCMCNDKHFSESSANIITCRTEKPSSAISLSLMRGSSDERSEDRCIGRTEILIDTLLNKCANNYRRYHCNASKP